MKKSALFVAGILAGAIALTFAFASVDLGTLARSLTNIDVTSVAVATASLILHLAIKTWRWSLLLGPRQGANFKTLAPVVALGSTGNMILPHAGELLRAYVLRRDNTAPAAFVLGTIAVERLFDFIAVLSLVTLVALIKVELPAAVFTAGSVVLGMCIAMVVVIAACTMYPGASEKVMSSGLSSNSSGLRRRAVSAIQNVMTGLSASRSATTYLIVVALSALQWFAMAVGIHACISAAGFAVPISASIIALFLSIAGLTLPTAPGYVGTLQVCFMIALVPFGVSQSDAVAASVIYNGVIVVTLLILGPIAMIHCGIGPKKIRELNSQ